MTHPDPQPSTFLDQSIRTSGESAATEVVLRSGVDIVGIARIARLLDEFGQSFKDRVFTPTEQAYCDGRPDPAQHYAARWAAKEAFQKAVATNGPPVPFDAVGVRRADDGPVLELAAPAEGALSETLQRETVPPARTTTSVSLAHDQPAGIAIAHVVIADGRSETTADASESPHKADQ